MTITEGKAALRATMRARREAMALADRLAAAQSIRLHFADHPHLTYAKSFAGYYAIRAEADLLPTFNHMQKFAKDMALPRTRAGSKQLAFHRWQPGQLLEDAGHGIKAPPATSESFTPEVILVPLLAFDACGYRLGYGGGYYDATMAALRSEKQKTLFVGVAYSTQEIESIPREDHDQPLNGILTELGVSFFQQSTLGSGT